MDKFLSTHFSTMIAELKKYREEHGISTYKMSAFIGVPRTRYQKWEDTNVKPKHEDSTKIANLLSKIKAGEITADEIKGKLSMDDYGKDKPKKEVEKKKTRELNFRI